VLHHTQRLTRIMLQHMGRPPAEARQNRHLDAGFIARTPILAESAIKPHANQWIMRLTIHSQAVRKQYASNPLC